MSRLDELYQEVLEHPDRDGPRRRYAEYLEQQGDELGEYIRLALDKDRHRLRAQDHARALDLKAALDDRLGAPLRPWIVTFQLDRGLVALVKMDARTFIEHGSDVFARAPIQHLDLVETKPVFAELMQSPVLARVQTLTLTKNGLGDKEAELLAACPHFRNLLSLDVWGNKIGMPGLEAITASPNFPVLRNFEFDYNLVDSPVSKWSNDGVSGLSDYEGAGPTQAILESKYGKKVWMHPSEGDQNLDRFRLCDAGE
jgi:uncharacterized protein (TIGR02996 family)